jgi:hypothetical protein
MENRSRNSFNRYAPSTELTNSSALPEMSRSFSRAADGGRVI